MVTVLQWNKRNLNRKDFDLVTVSTALADTTHTVWGARDSVHTCQY